MSQNKAPPTRFIGLDVHKHYLIAIGVDIQLNQVLGPQRVQLAHLEKWIPKTLAHQDAVVLEMTTNAFQLHDDLLPHVHSVTLVHPPHVRLITRAQVMTDKIAALTLARLHAAGLLPPVWVPPQEVRDRRALLAQRSKMVRLRTQAKNRLHAVLHRHHILPREGDLFTPAARDWWLDLPITPLDRRPGPSPLGAGTKTTRTPTWAQEGDCGDCPKTAGGCMARADQGMRRPVRGSAAPRPQVDTTLLLSRKGQPAGW